jgi:hypothetical protein
MLAVFTYPEKGIPAAQESTHKQGDYAIQNVQKSVQLASRNRPPELSRL